MMIASRTIWIACLVSLCGPASALDWTLRMDGLGPLRIGMHFDEVNARVGRQLKRSEPSLQPTPGCDEIALPLRPGVSLMFIDDVLERIDVSRPGTKTEKAISVGDPAARVLSTYPRIRQEKNSYDNTERYLTVDSADHRFSLRFETDHARIAHFYAGARKQVRYVEGCL
jgi:hypothetical protein